ncbi:MAG: HEAT repeat domain-containing protein [Rhodothermales bacterium]
MGLFGPPDIDKLAARGRVKPLIRALKHKNYKVARGAAEALGKLGDMQAFDSLIRALADRRTVVRIAAADALAKLGDVRAVDPLIELLRANEWQVRPVAAQALGTLADARAVEPLIDALGDRRLKVRRAAVQALKRFKDTRTVETLIGLLGDSHLRDDVVKMLGTLKDPRAVEPLILRLSKEKDHKRRRILTDALSKLDKLAIQPAIEALHNERKNVRRAAADTLDLLGWQPEKSEVGARYWMARDRFNRCISLGTIAIQPLIDAFEDKDWGIAEKAVKTLGKIDDPRAVEALIDTLEHPRNTARSTVIKVLGKSGDSRAVEPLIDVLSSDVTEERKAAIRALGKLGDVRAVAPLLEMLKEDTLSMRRTTTEALDQLGWQPDRGKAGVRYWITKGHLDQCVAFGPPAIEGLIDALEDTRPEVKKAAAEALLQIGDSSLGPLVERLNNERPSVRRIAAETLGRHGDARAVTPLIQALTDEDHTVRKAAALALEQMASSAVEPLIDALRCIKGDLGNAAAQLLDRLGWQPGGDETEAYYWIAKGEIKPCIALGQLALEPLNAALEHDRWQLRRSVVHALEEIDDPRVVSLLIRALADKKWEVRRDAAHSLVARYQYGGLDETDKRRLLNLRATITREHEDAAPGPVWSRFGNCAFLEGHRKHHRDTGIGVDFPL